MEEEALPIGRSRNAIVEVLTEGDIFVLDGDYSHVSDGEISVFADGSIDCIKGIVAPCDPEQIKVALSQGKHIVNIDEL